MLAVAAASGVTLLLKPIVQKWAARRLAERGVEALHADIDDCRRRAERVQREIVEALKREHHFRELVLNPVAIGGRGTLKIPTIAFRPGLSNPLPEPANVIRLQAAKGQADDAARIQDAIAKADVPARIRLGAGTYRINKTIALRSGIVLSGSGMRRTVLLFEGAADCIALLGDTRSGVEIVILDGCDAGSRVLRVAQLAGLEPGQLVKVYSDNPPDRIVSGYRTPADVRPNAYGQLVGIVRVTPPETVEIDVPLRLQYRSDLNPRLRVIEPISFAGVEDLSVFVSSPQEGSAANTDTVRIDGALNCVIRGCEFSHSRNSHVWITDSRFVTVQRNYVHHGRRYDGRDGLWGYGVCLAERVSDCLVEDNVFESLRHAVILETGANGNVVAYNYSTGNNPQRNRDDSCDFSVHGFYAYANLFEGNLFQFAESSDFFGRAGPFITFYRNRVEGLGIKITNGSHMAVVVANEFVRGGTYVGFDVAGTVVIGSVHANSDPRPGYAKAILVRGQRVDRDERLVASLYRERKPAFLVAANWPCFGPDIEAATDSWRLPAAERYRMRFAKWEPLRRLRGADTPRPEDNGTVARP